MADTSSSSVQLAYGALKRKASEGNSPRKRAKVELGNEVEALGEVLDTAVLIIPEIFSQVELIKCAIKDIKRGIYMDVAVDIFNTPLAMPESARTDKTHANAVNWVNDHLKLALGYLEPVIKYENALPTPSEYAQRHVWKVWQEKPDAILCLRPPDKKGLPLFVLHDVFRDFQLKTLPLTDDGAEYFNAALALSEVIGKCFDTESERKEAFQTCLASLFHWSGEHGVVASSEMLSGQADACVVKDGVVTVFREDKVDIGDGHDAYMQASRLYQIYVSSLREKGSPLLGHGAPVFLVVIQGPMLWISGGFWDGKSTTVEPLAPPCMMLPDYGTARQRELARQLFALNEGIATIAQYVHAVRAICVALMEGFVTGLGISPTPWPSFAPATPRIYRSFTTPFGEERGLAFSEPLGTITHRLMFRAKIAEVSDASQLAPASSASHTPDVLVKLVYHGYGEEVHKLLAEHGLAPFLYGTKHIDGAPTAVVMEYLPPPSTTSGWVTMHNFAIQQDVRPHEKIIREGMDNILAVLREHKMVHGDLRSNNIMLKVASGRPVQDGDRQGTCLKVIDFDWAGRNGEVRYPMQRNNKNISWPAGRNEPIIMDYDPKQVEWWLEKLF